MGPGVHSSGSPRDLAQPTALPLLLAFLGKAWGLEVLFEGTKVKATAEFPVGCDSTITVLTGLALWAPVLLVWPQGWGGPPGPQAEALWDSPLSSK